VNRPESAGLKSYHPAHARPRCSVAPAE
jgi:hypothetical protein